MKKIIALTAASLFIITAFAAAPGSKVIQAFNQTFPNAENVKWYDDKAGYFVSFYQDGNFEKVLYNKDGDFIFSWKYFSGKDLPTSVIMSLNKKYGESKILGVTEVTSQENVNYEIKISKGSTLYSVTTLADGKIVKEEKYNQAENNDAAER